MLVVLAATSSLVAFNCAPLTASVLVAVKSPAVTLVILLVVLAPWAALKAVLPLSHCNASSPRPSTASCRLVILVVLSATSLLRLVMLVVLAATSSLVAFNCAPLTASVLVAVKSPAVTLVILLVVLVLWLALKALLALSHCRASSPSVSIASVRLLILVVLSATSLLRSVMLVVLAATSSLVACNCEPLMASVLPAATSPSATLVMIFVALEPWLALNLLLVLFQCRVSSSIPVSAAPTLL